MRIISLGFRHFRNLEDSLIQTDSNRIMFIGENGAGKTSFLEAIYLLCYGSSFRTENLREAVKTGFKDFTLKAVVIDDDGYKQTIETDYSAGVRKTFINEREIKDRKELMYNIPCIVFAHDDIEFVKGEPEKRRRFFDQMMSMYSPQYFLCYRKYRTALKQRNAAIKNGDMALAGLYDPSLARYGLEIEKMRSVTVDEFNTVFPSLYRRVSGEERELTIRYRPSWKGAESEEDVLKILKEGEERDKIFLTTTTGVHRDRFEVYADSLPFASYGSTGEQRLASLLFRTAEASFFCSKTGRKPLLLVDDVLLELNGERRAAYLENIGLYSQAFFTFLPGENYFGDEGVCDGLVYRAENGEFVKNE